MIKILTILLAVVYLAVLFLAMLSVRRRAIRREKAKEDKAEARRKARVGLFYSIEEWEKRAARTGNSDMRRCLKDLSNRILEI